MDLSSEIRRIGKTEMRKKKNKIWFTEQETEAALQLIHLNNSYQTCPIVNSTKSQHHLHEPSMKIVPKTEKFQVPEVYENDDDNNYNINMSNIRKRKSDGIVSCNSSITFDLDHNSVQDAGEAVSNHVKKIKKFRSIFDLYNVITKPL